jgi:hypothetical protein
LGVFFIPASVAAIRSDSDTKSSTVLVFWSASFSSSLTAFASSSVLSGAKYAAMYVPFFLNKSRYLGVRSSSPWVDGRIYLGYM